MGAGKEAKVELAEYHIQAQEALGCLDGALDRLATLTREIEGANTEMAKEAEAPPDALSSFLKELPDYLRQRATRVANATTKLRTLLLKDE